MFFIFPNFFRRLNRCRNKRKKTSLILILILVIFFFEEFYVFVFKFGDFQVCPKLGSSKADIETAAEYQNLDFNVSQFF